MFYSDIHFTYPAFGEIYKMRDIFAISKCDIILQAKLRYDINPFSLAFAHIEGAYTFGVCKGISQNPKVLYRTF